MEPSKMKKKYVRVSMFINNNEIEDYLNNNPYHNDYNIIYYSEIAKDSLNSRIIIVFEKTKSFLKI